MNKISEIQYNIVSYDDTKGIGRLEINIKGNDINYIIVNTIRRAILTYIPIYAFNEFNFTINESIFNNNYMKLRLRNLPVWGITNNIDKIESKIKKHEEIIDDDNENYEDNVDINMETNNNLNSSSLNQLTMYVDYKNNDKIIVTVTTDNAKFYCGEKNIDTPYKTPIPLVKLQPDQNINFSAITTLGCEKENAIYSAVSVCFYKENSEHDFNFIVESRGQILEQRIIDVALINIIDTIENFIKLIPENQTNNFGEILINDENDTVGNLLSYGLQNHKKVKFAGYNVPHPLGNKVVINYELLNKDDNIKNILNDVVKYLTELFKQILKLNSKKFNKKN